MKQRSFRSVLDQGRVGAARGPQSAQTVNPLQQVRLALSVSTRYEIQAGIELHRLAAVVAEVFELDPSHPQDAYDNLTGINR
jgi:hypothetical protein